MARQDFKGLSASQDQGRARQNLAMIPGNSSRELQHYYWTHLGTVFKMTNQTSISKAASDFIDSK